MDFLSAHRLLIDPIARLVLDAKMLLPINNHAALCSVALSSIPLAVRSLLASFPAIAGDGKGTPKPRHGVEHTVETPKPAAWTRTSYARPRPSFDNWKRPASSAAPTLRGPHRST